MRDHNPLFTLFKKVLLPSSESWLPSNLNKSGLATDMFAYENTPPPISVTNFEIFFFYVSFFPVFIGALWEKGIISQEAALNHLYAFFAS